MSKEQKDIVGKIMQTEAKLDERSVNDVINSHLLHDMLPEDSLVSSCAVLLFATPIRDGGNMRTALYTFFNLMANNYQSYTAKSIKKIIHYTSDNISLASLVEKQSVSKKKQETVVSYCNSISAWLKNYGIQSNNVKACTKMFSDIAMNLSAGENAWGNEMTSVIFYAVLKSWDYIYRNSLTYLLLACLVEVLPIIDDPEQNIQLLHLFKNCDSVKEAAYV